MAPTMPCVLILIVCLAPPLAKGGHDLIKANRYTNDTDIIRAGRGSFDKINVRDGDPRDRIRAGAGAHDWCITDANSELGGGCERVN